MNILEEIYDGELWPRDEGFEPTKERTDWTGRVADLEEKLLRRLGDEEREMLSDILETQLDILCSDCKDYFICGWRLGAKVMLDTFIIGQDKL